MQPTKEEVRLAKPAVDAIEVIAGERECPKCKGLGQINVPGSIVTCHCGGSGKMKYVWKPEVGEWCIHREKNHIGLIYKYWPIGIYQNLASIKVVFPCSDKESNMEHFASEFIPILPWETIRKIVEDAGYSMSNLVRDIVSDEWHVSFQLYYYKHKKDKMQYAKYVAVGNAKRVQEAVMLAAIGLGEKLKCRQKK